MESKTAGKNMPSGVITYFHLKDTASADTVKIQYKEKSGKVIATYSTHPDKKQRKKS